MSSSYDELFNIHVQSQDMDDLKKEEFLDNFVSSPNKTNLGIVVLGGAFSEGIDFVYYNSIYINNQYSFLILHYKK